MARPLPATGQPGRAEGAHNDRVLLTLVASWRRAHLASDAGDPLYQNETTSILTARIMQFATDGARCGSVPWFAFLLILALALPSRPPLSPSSPSCRTKTNATACPSSSLVALFTTPEPEASPVASPAALPDGGAPVDDPTQAAMVTRTRAVSACFNAGDYWALITVFRDDYLLRSFGPAGPMDPLAEELAPFGAAVRGVHNRAADREPIGSPSSL